MYYTSTLYPNITYSEEICQKQFIEVTKLYKKKKTFQTQNHKPKFKIVLPHTKHVAVVI